MQTPDDRSPDPGVPGSSERETPDGAVAAPGPLAPLHRRITQAFFAPGTLFRALDREPAIAGALFLGAALVALSGLALPVEVYEEGFRQQMQAVGQELPGDPVTMARFMKVAAVFGSVVIWPIMAVLSAGVIALVLMFGFGFEGSFRRYLSVTAHAFLVPAVAALLLVPLRILARDPSFTLSVGNLAFFLPEEGLVSRFLGFLDLLNLWAYALIGLGAAIVDGARSAATAVSVTVGLVVLVTLVATVLTG